MNVSTLLIELGKCYTVQVKQLEVKQLSICLSSIKGLGGAMGE